MLLTIGLRDVSHWYSQGNQTRRNKEHMQDIQGKTGTEWSVGGGVLWSEMGIILALVLSHKLLE